MTTLIIRDVLFLFFSEISSNRKNFEHCPYSKKLSLFKDLNFVNEDIKKNVKTKMRKNSKMIQSPHQNICR